MPTHVFYHRAGDGLIERLDYLIYDRPHLLGTYPYQQKLVGFSEPVVFWADATGETVGIAPVLPSQD